jgi:hypothetical protein
VDDHEQLPFTPVAESKSRYGMVKLAAVMKPVVVGSWIVPVPVPLVDNPTGIVVVI